MMNCDKIAEKLGLYIDGTLDEHGLEEVEAHLKGCADCRAELAALRLIISTAHEIEEVEPPTGLRERIAAATTAADALKSARIPIFARLRQALAAPAVRWATGSAVAAVVVCVAFLLRPAPQPVKVALHRPKPSVVTVKPKTTTPAAAIAVAPAQKPVVVAAHPAGRVHRSRVASSKLIKVAKGKALPAVSVPKKTAGAPSTEAANTVVSDTTTSTVTVSAEELAAAETASVDVPVKTITKSSPKVAATAAVSQEQMRKWLDEAKTEASMHRRERGPDGFRLLSTRF